MSHEVPPILWYLLWAFVLTVLPLVMILSDHRRRMKGLEILKLYAEKGQEPPAQVAELLVNDSDGPSKVATQKMNVREARFGGFVGFTFMACALGAVVWWMMESGGPRFVLYPIAAFAGFFGVGAVGFLVVALFTRDK